jgi:hypothetical protein
MPELPRQSNAKPMQYYVARAVACPVCGAEPGAVCINRSASKNGEVMRGVHRLRDQRYNEARFHGELA